MVCYGRGELGRQNAFIRGRGSVCEYKKKLQLSLSPRAPSPHFRLALLTWTHGPRMRMITIWKWPSFKAKKSKEKALAAYHRCWRAWRHYHSKWWDVQRIVCTMSQSRWTCMCQEKTTHINGSSSFKVLSWVSSSYLGCGGVYSFIPYIIDLLRKYVVHHRNFETCAEASCLHSPRLLHSCRCQEAGGHWRFTG